MTDATALVGVIMGSDSDLRVMQDAIDTLDEFDVPSEVQREVRDAQRTSWIAYIAPGQGADTCQ